MLRAGVVNGPALFEELRTPWKSLVEDSPSATPFQTYEWQSTWWKHFGRLKKPLAITVHEGNDLVGLMPLVQIRGFWRTLRPMGIGPSDYLHPLVREGYESSASEMIVEAVSKAKNVDLVDLHQVRETRALAAHAAGSVIEQATCLLLDLPDTYDQYLSMLGKSLRYDVRKLDKTLFKEGRAQIVPSTGADTDRCLEILFDQHRRRWRKRGLPGAFLGRVADFHRDWAQAAARNGWLWLSVLNLDGNAVGAIYGMTLGKTVYYYQAGFDPQSASFSPGTLLVAHTIRRAIDEGKRQFDFMRGDEPYKRRWKPQHVLKNLRILQPTASLAGRLGSSWNHTGSRVETRVRARLEGRGLL